MTPQRFSTIQSVLSRRQPDLTVVTDEVHKGRNLSAIVRTCDAVGIGRVHCVEPKQGYRPYRGTALGSHKWVETCLYREVSEPIEALKQSGHQIVVAHLSPRAVDFREVDYTKPTALLMGTERQGVSESGLAIADIEVTVPMVGMVESLNVSVACAVILMEAQRQRQLAGLYDHRRLDDEEYHRTLFRWCQPVLSAYCDKHFLSYPELDHEGDVKNPSQWYKAVRE